MADPKIKVGADMSAAIAEVGKLEAAASKVADTLNSSSVGIDVKQAKADLESLKDAAESLANHLQTAKNIPSGDMEKFSKALDAAAGNAESLEKVLEAVGQATGFDKSVRGAKGVADNLERARKAQEALTRDGIKLSDSEVKAAKAKFDAWKASGARGTSKLKNIEFDDWASGGWRNHSIDQQESKRQRRKVLEALDIKPSGSAAEDMRARFGGRGMGALGGAVGGIAGSVLNGGDGFFSAVGGAGGGLIGTGAGALIGGPAGAAIGAVVGTVGSKVLGAFGSLLDQSLQRVLKDAVNLTDLRHSISATAIDFDQMRQSVRDATADLRLTNEEASQLARTFSNAYGQIESSQQLAAGTRLGAGFSRSFGLDPSMGVSFFGTMRRMGQEGDTRLALKISEAVSKNGVTPQMGAVLQALQAFTEQQTRLSFTKANTEGYASFMSSMLGSTLAGSKDVGTVSSAMGAADAAMRQGGAYGEASKVFSLGTYQRALPGFSVFDLDVMKDQGAFGTVGKAFGRDSAAYKFAKDHNDKATMARYDRFANSKIADRSVLSVQMEGLERFYGGNTDQLRKTIMNNFGVTAGQASALYDAYKRPGGLGGLEKQLKAAGVDMTNILPQQMGDLAQVAGMSGGQIKVQAKKLLEDSSLNLSEKEKTALQSQSVDEQRKAVLKITALHDTQKDEGEKIDQLNVSMKRLADDVTTRLTPAMIQAKQFLFDLVQHFMPEKVWLDGPAGTTNIDPKRFSAGQKFIMNKIDAAAEKYAPGDVGYRNYLRGLGWQESHFVNKSGTPTFNKRLGKWDVARGPMQIMQSRIDEEHIDMSDMGIDYTARVNLPVYKKHGVQGAARNWFTGTTKPTHRKDVNGRDAMDYGSMVEANSNGFAKLDQAAAVNNTVRDAVSKTLGAVSPALGAGVKYAMPDVVHPNINPGRSVTVPMKPLDHTVTVRIVDDKTGKEVKTKVAGPMPAGTHVEIVR